MEGRRTCVKLRAFPPRRAPPCPNLRVHFQRTSCPLSNGSLGRAFRYSQRASLPAVERPAGRTFQFYLLTTHEPPRHRRGKGLRLGLVLSFRQRRRSAGLSQGTDRSRRRARAGDQPLPQLQISGHRLLRLAARRGARAQGDSVGAHDQRSAQARAVWPRHRGSEPEADQIPARGRTRRDRLRRARLFRRDQLRGTIRSRAAGVRHVPVPDPAP